MTSKTHTIAFNTGRFYTEHGQRIVATLHDDGAITFHDIDRQIDGVIAGPNPVLSESRVLGAYDRGEYSGSRRSMRDADRDGVNSRTACVCLLRVDDRPRQIVAKRPT